MEPLPPGSYERGANDIRRGAGTMAAILGSMGGFVVTAVVLVFTTAHDGRAPEPAILTLITGFLVLALLGCVLGAFALAAIAGELALKPNVPASGMYVGAIVTIAVASILAAFQGLSVIYLPSSAILFAAITTAGALAGQMLNALVVIDAWANHPRAVKWIRTRPEANRWSLRVGLLGGMPIVCSFALYAAGIHIRWDTTAANWFIGLGIGLVVGLSVCGTIRSVHSRKPSRALGRAEAIAIQTIGAGYLVALIISLPAPR